MSSANVSLCNRHGLQRLLGAILLWWASAAASFAQSLPDATSLQQFLSLPQADVEIPECGGAARMYTLWETISKSVCGKPDPERPFTPLRLTTLLSEGWLEPWIPPPSGSSGAVRQGWIGDYQAFFNRNVFGVYSYARGDHGRPNEHLGVAVFETPISRRLMIGIATPFVDSLQNGPLARRPRVSGTCSSTHA
jgi:hypothetical protein